MLMCDLPAQDDQFFPDLFARLQDLSEQRKKGLERSEGWTDLVAFLQELCGLSKHLQMNNRGQLLSKLINLDLFEVPLPVPRQ